MKRLFTILAAVCMAASMMAEVQSINPTACGITVGETTRTGKTLDQWSDILKDYRPMNTIVMKGDQEVYIGDFVVEGFHMSVMDMELINDTVYELSFYERSPYADCWDSYKDLAFELRDKYAHFEDVREPFPFDNDSLVTFFKTDGKTMILFVAEPKNISITLINVHFQNIKTSRLAEEMVSALTAKTGPNYDEKNKVTSIAGVRFGETKTNTITAFKQRGTFVKNEGDITYFSNLSFGGSIYNTVTFLFQYDSWRKDNVLAAASFEKNFYKWEKEEALMMYESVASAFQGKYSNCTMIKDEDDAKLMVCGMLEDEYEEGKIPPIIVSFSKAVSRGGDMFYYVTVSYFVQKMSSVAADDI